MNPGKRMEFDFASWLLKRKEYQYVPSWTYQEEERAKQDRRRKATMKA
ncbi:hypothetical protein [Pseudobacteriovorax antillogorgiicola]|uniref:Uncharacterized protein n=1 Tax=Pseudobacteriovorax antillogorgiicola TaxID=1513793 RepID=A0A1Y6CEZ0_9BACT|nr:hypothetical protein [Pseudobacteriovorax antillogorgiicola]TCS49038.1 hypothetical protein EDD56_11681 [Pseudobacteriovorax antillogorgiicola]SMF52677.1 hypothetical protein SAMN06296036_11673 [Pseudobacteriovorax antillogorgiicola]